MRIDISNRIGTTSNFGGFRGLLDKFSGAAAGYSLRKLSKSATNAVRVRRSSDNTEQDIGFTGTELDTTTLLDFVNARDVAPADYGAGAAAAYSLRYVSDSYTADVVRVRRSVDNAEADFNPTEITDGTLLAWVGNTASDNGYVTTWYDQSGNSNDATQGTAASQPKIVDAGVLVEENGKPAVDFDGVDDVFNMDVNINNNYSVFFALNSPTNTTNYILGGNLTGSSPAIIHGYTGTKIEHFTPTGDREDFNTSTVSNSQQLLNVNITNGSSLTTYANNILGASITPITDYSTAKLLRIGNSTTGSNYSNFKAKELIIYNSDQSSNRGNIEANVNDYYSIYTSTNDGFVTTWYDQAGSNDATQATAAYQPQIVDGGSLITENGKVALDFDGVDDFLQGLSLTIDSVFSVLIPPDIGSTIEPLLSGPSRALSFAKSTSIYYLSPFNYTETYTDLSLGSAYYDGSDAYMFMNGNASASNPQSATRLTAVDEIGRYSISNFFNKKILEIIIYDTNQSANRTNIEAAINGHYNIYP
jgi:hypothetical protein